MAAALRSATPRQAACGLNWYCREFEAEKQVFPVGEPGTQPPISSFLNDFLNPLTNLQLI
jgi:hypothetical protein